MDDIYIASAWRNKERVAKLVEALRAKGKTVRSMLENKYNFLEGATAEEEMQEFESIQNWREDERIMNMTAEDIKQIMSSQTVILLLPAGKSSHFEAGLSFGLKLAGGKLFKVCPLEALELENRKLILIGKIEQIEAFYLAFDQHFETDEEYLVQVK